MQLRPLRPNHLARFVTLEQAVHEHEFYASFHRFLSTTRPLLRIERRKRPQRLYRRHERAMVHHPTVSSRSFTIPASVITLIPHKPFKHLAHASIILKSKLGERSRHVSGYTGLPDQTPPPQILIRILRRRPRTILPVHDSKKILASSLDRGIRSGNTHF